jgi:hypothetical protein
VWPTAGAEGMDLSDNSSLIVNSLLIATGWPLNQKSWWATEPGEVGGQRGVEWDGLKSITHCLSLTLRSSIRIGEAEGHRRGGRAGIKR